MEQRTIPEEAARRLAFDRYYVASLAADGTSQVLRVSDLTLNTGTYEVDRAGKSLTLTPICLKLLIALMKSSPKVISRRDLERAVWDDIVPDSDALRSHLYNLRKVIDKPFERPLLHTVHGAGYRLADTDAH